MSGSALINLFPFRCCFSTTDRVIAVLFISCLLQTTLIVFHLSYPDATAKLNCTVPRLFIHNPLPCMYIYHLRKVIWETLKNITNGITKTFANKQQMLLFPKFLQAFQNSNVLFLNVHHCNLNNEY